MPSDEKLNRLLRVRLRGKLIFVGLTTLTVNPAVVCDVTSHRLVAPFRRNLVSLWLG